VQHQVAAWWINPWWIHEDGMIRSAIAAYEVYVMYLLALGQLTLSRCAVMPALPFGNRNRATWGCSWLEVLMKCAAGKWEVFRVFVGSWILKHHLLSVFGRFHFSSISSVASIEGGENHCHPGFFHMASGT